MATSSPEVAKGSKWRALVGVILLAGLLAGGVAVYALGSLLTFLTSAGRDLSERGSSASSRSTTLSIVTPTLPSLASATPSATAATPAGSHRILLPTDPDPPNPAAKFTHAMNYGDAFESWDGKPSEIRTLVTVGALRLGVTRTSTVRDEARVTAVLDKLGHELEAREKGRRDSWEARAIEYGPILDKYGAQLAGAMDGDFAFHTGSWVLFHPSSGAAASPSAAIASSATRSPP